MKPYSTYSREFKEVYVSFFPRMRRFANVYIRSEAEAENLVQDIFMELWEKKTDLAEISNIRGYMFVLLKHRCIDYLRHRKAGNVMGSDISEISDINLKCASLENIDDDLLSDPDLDKMLFDAIDKLPEKCRKIFVMNKFRGKKQAEIAKEMNISTNTVESQMAIAYKKLKESLHDYFYFFLFFFIFN